MFLGKNGGIALAEEDVAYGTAGTVFVHQHPIRSTLMPRKEINLPQTLRSAMPATREYDFDIPNGDVEVGMNLSRAVIDPALAVLGTLATNTYTIGNATAPDRKSLTGRINHGGINYQFTGLVPQRARFVFHPKLACALTLSMVGNSSSKPATVAPSNPAESGLLMPSDVSGVTVGGTALRCLGGTIEVTLPYTGGDRRSLNSGGIIEPELQDIISLELALNVELNDATSANTVAIVDSWLAGTPLGTIIIGSAFSLYNCYMQGDGSPLQNGIQPFTIRSQPSYMEIVTAA